MSSSFFIGERSLEFTDSTDNNFGPVNIAKDVIDIERKAASASVFGFKKRTAVFREGLGSVLINDSYDADAPYLTPERNYDSNDSLSYPYGTAKAIDSIFSNIDYNNLQKAVNDAFQEGLNTRSVLVIYKDHIIAEKYAEGFNKNSRLLGWSMNKSILSTLYGILQKEGKLDVFDKAPVEEWKSDSRKEVTINDLLQMNSGLEWDENYATISDATKMLFLASDMTLSQQKKKAKAAPGTLWNYSSGTSNLLSGILRDQFNSHQKYLNFPYRELIDKIGMHSMLLETDLSGNFVASSYGWATTRDWGKFGLLYLHEGNWNGEQIFDTSWVDYITTPAPDSNQRYGGHFWLNKGGYLPNVPKDIYYADGFQGQRVFIIPSKDMVVVRFGLGNMDFNGFLKEVLGSVE